MRGVCAKEEEAARRSTRTSFLMLRLDRAASSRLAGYRIDLLVERAARQRLQPRLVLAERLRPVGVLLRPLLDQRLVEVLGAELRGADRAVPRADGEETLR